MVLGRLILVIAEEVFYYRNASAQFVISRDELQYFRKVERMRCSALVALSCKGFVLMTKLFNENFIATDPELKNILSNSKLNTVRQWLERQWEIYEPFADKNFRIEIATNFHQRFWEMYLTCSLLEFQYEIKAQKTEKGPDICIHQNGCRIWIEAIAPGSGNGDNAVPPIALNARTWTFYREPENQIILRYRSALQEKLCKYISYREGKINMLQYTLINFDFTLAS